MGTPQTNDSLMSACMMRTWQRASTCNEQLCWQVHIDENRQMTLWRVCSMVRMNAIRTNNMAWQERTMRMGMMSAMGMKSERPVKQQARGYLARMVYENG